MVETKLDVRLGKVQDRGGIAIAILVASSVVGFPGSWFLPPPLVSIVVGAVAVVYLVIQEVRYGSTDSSTGRRGRRVYGLASLAAIPAGLVSWLFQSLASMPDVCEPLTSGGGRLPSLCFSTTDAETNVRITWIVVMVIMAAVLVAGMVLSSKSKLAVQAAFPIVIAACALALDLSHAVALATGKNPDFDALSRIASPVDASGLGQAW